MKTQGIAHILLFFLLPICSFFSHAQNSSDNSYLIWFTDKANSPYNIGKPEEFLSERAIERRSKNGVAIGEEDLPVNPAYQDSLRACGARLMFTSKWLNTATISVDTSIIIDRIEDLPFVASSERIFRKREMDVEIYNQAGILQNTYTGNTDYGESYRQVEMLNGIALHDAGFKGAGTVLAVIDAGFDRVDSLIAFENLLSGNKILSTYDFVDQDKLVYDHHNHGTAVLSVMGGYLEGKLMGTATEADYILLRSENAGSEYIIEEDAWIAAAEFADSAGADVINSSLGYSVFDNPAMNHTYAEMDGHTTRIAKAANIAYSKGILVVVSAGNEGNDSWKYITSPGDADSVITVGAVDENGIYAEFSSIGPDYDGDVKPNVSAMGLYTVAASTTDGEVTYASGTSLASPLIAGMTACLVGAFPDMPAYEIKDAIEKSAHLYAMPNEQLGYGIPDFSLAYRILKLKDEPYGQLIELLELYPNPFTDHLTVSFYSEKKADIELSVYDNMGRLIYSDIYSVPKADVQKIDVDLPADLQNGMYILSISNGVKNIVEKIMKFN